MPRAYSIDLRIRLVRLVENGHSARSAAKILSVSACTAAGWIRQWRRDKSVDPCRMRGHRRELLETHADWLLALAQSEKNLTLESVRARLVQHGVKVSLWTIWSFFSRRKIVLKKSPRRAARPGKSHPSSKIHSTLPSEGKRQGEPEALVCDTAVDL